MDQLVVVTALVIVVTAATYLVTLGVGAFLRPESARRFLGGFATTRRLHFVELALRTLVGIAFVISAPRMALGDASRVFGWVLITTSIGLTLVPWQLHQRFALWSVPRATQYLSLIGAASLTAGIGLIVAVVLPYAAR